MPPRLHSVRKLSWPLLAALSLSMGCALTPPTTPETPTVLEVQGAFAKRKQADSQVQGGPKASAATAIRNLAAAGATGKPGKMLLAIYMIGSDLEDNVNGNKIVDEQELDGLSNWGNATADLKELLEAYNQLSGQEKENLDVLVCFGGARSSGWRGVKYVDLKGLNADGADGYFGNETTPDVYLVNDEGADMGDAKVFQKFLEGVQARSQGASKVFLDMWDHGASYGGMGPDVTTMKTLSNKAMREAFEATKFKGDIIGYDACLMASAEVMAAVKNHFSYMVASEETEPGHGWDYSAWVAYAAKNPSASLSDIGTQVIDTFIDSPRHQATNGRSLSLINLEKAGAMLSALDALGQNLQGKLHENNQGILDAVSQAPKFGSHGKSSDEFALDLLAFAEKLKVQAPAAKDAADALATAVKNCVVYARQDGTMPNAHGISLFNLQNHNHFTSGIYNRDNAASPQWFSFVESFLNRGANDTQAPTFGEFAQAEVGGLAGTKMKVDDNLGIEKVRSLHLTQPDPIQNRFLIVSEEDAQEIAPNVYFQSNWDGKFLLLDDGAGTRATVPIRYEETVDGFKVYNAPGQWNGSDAIFYFVMDGERRIVNSWANLFETMPSGQVIMARQQFELTEGDTISFYLEYFDANNDQRVYGVTKPLTLPGAPNFVWEKAAEKCYFFTVAQDMKGNAQNTDIQVVGP